MSSIAYVICHNDYVKFVVIGTKDNAIKRRDEIDVMKLKNVIEKTTWQKL